MDEEVQKTLSKLQNANKIMENLIDKAMQDNKLSEDEKQILFVINDNLNLYARRIMESIEDGQITNNEKEKIKEIEMKIIKDAKEIASRDDKITEEEKTLIDDLVKNIKAVGT